MLTAVLVGCGAMSVRWLEAIAKIDDLRLVGLVDLDSARAQARAAEFGLADVAVGSDLGAVLAATRPDIVFDVVTPQARRRRRGHSLRRRLPCTLGKASGDHHGGRARDPRVRPAP